MNSFFRKKNKGLLVLLVLLPLITTFTIMNAETIFSWTPENEQEEKSAEDVIGEISFPEEMIQGEVDHVLDFIFYSEDALDTVDLALPEQVIIDQESLIEGLTAVETENEGVWQLTSETPQTTFVLPIIVDTIGEYEIIVADSASQRLLIVENTVIEDIDQDEDENDSAEAAPEEEVDEASDEAAKEAEVDDRSDPTAKIRIERADFLDHFDLQGEPIKATYNEQTGVVLLTPDLPNHVGNVTLKERLSLDHPFTLKGKANIGTRLDGADGIAFGFHNSATDEVGYPGNAFGIGGLIDGFGFKLDNNYNTTPSVFDEFTYRFEVIRDPISVGGAPFAGFIYHTGPRLMATYTGNDALPQRAGNRLGHDLDVLIQYQPDENGRWFQVDYDNRTWRRDISDWQPEDVSAMAFLITGSTGARSDRHTFTFDWMEYHIGTGTVHVNYLDRETGEHILPAETLDLPLRTLHTLDPKNRESDEPYQLGYDYYGVEYEAEYFDPDTFDIMPQPFHQEVTFLFERVPSNIKINHIDEEGVALWEPTYQGEFVNESVDILPLPIPYYQYLYERDGQPLETRVTRDEQEYWLVYGLERTPQPVDPLDPDTQVNPENPPEIDEEQGFVSLDFVSQFQFGTVGIRSETTTYDALPQKLLHPADPNDNLRPNYVQVSDRRRENSGWTLRATLRTPFESDEGHQLNGARILLNNIDVATTRENASDPPTYKPQATLTVGQAEVIAQANANEGRGTWVQRFGDRETMDQSVKLEVPVSAAPQATRYTATILWELSFVP
ncbi:WxL domain-containing protein [Enterococcus casseliflavus]|uniref:lectin-like domain-containing protein n=1 Tax=Enterococcus casseliflavus TaxID=37734 RepID=UPI00325ACD36